MAGYLSSTRASSLRLAIFVLGGMLIATSAKAATTAECQRAAQIRGAGLVKGIDQAESQKLFREAIELCPKMSEAHFDLARSYLLRGEIDAAIESFKKSAELNPEIRYQVGLANAYVQKGDLASAEKLYQEQIERDPKDSRAYHGLSYIAAERGELARAEELLRQGIQMEPSSSQLFFNLGVILERAGKLADAAVSYQAAIEKNSGYVDALIKLSRVWLKLGEFNKAEQTAGRAVLLSPESVSAQRILAAVLFQKGKYQRAGEHIIKAAELEPQNREIKRDRAVIEIAQGSEEEGINQLKELLASSPSEEDRADIFGALGWAYLRENKLELAEKNLRSALERRDDDPFAHNNLGVFLEVAGRPQEAVASFQKAKDLAPGFRVAEQNLELLSANK